MIAGTPWLISQKYLSFALAQRNAERADVVPPVQLHVALKQTKRFWMRFERIDSRLFLFGGNQSERTDVGADVKKVAAALQQHL